MEPERSCAVTAISGVLRTSKKIYGVQKEFYVINYEG